MTKAARQKSRRLKRTVRKTLGTLFLISALVIAAIPVDGLRAAEGDVQQPRASYDPANSSIDHVTNANGAMDIPKMDPDTKIYTSEDRLIRFAYLEDSQGYGAVIVGYGGGELKDGVLDLSKPVNAYGQYRINDGSGYNNYVAVGLKGNFLFYKERRQQTVTGTSDAPVDTAAIKARPEFISEVTSVTDANGMVTSFTWIEEFGECQPCFMESKEEKWGKFDDQTLYYDAADPTGEKPSDGHTPNFQRVGADTNYLPIKNAPITYISHQYISTVDGKWVYTAGSEVTSSNKEKGVFATYNNIKKLTVSEKLKGIGDYAFYNSGITEIKLENGLRYIGKGAFENCLSLTTADFNVDCNLTMLGACAFRNCQALTSFVLPSGVTQIGDFAFEGCHSITNVDLCSGRNVSALNALGQGVFKDCRLLETLTFPNNCNDTVYVSSFQGCENLKWISTRNRQITFKDEPGFFSFDDFKNMVAEEFYFEGLGNYTTDKIDFSELSDAGWDSMVHKMAWEECFAFRYLRFVSTGVGQEGTYEKQDHYELTVRDESDPAGAAKNTFVVNSSNELEKHTPSKGVKTLDIPKKIGPYSIALVNAGVFQNWCGLEKVTIPETVKTVRSNAFSGCHNLKHVIFESGDIVLEADAFRTQVFTGGDHDQNNYSCQGVESAPDGSPAKKLHFTGPISSSSAPFNYAMSGTGRYNDPSQMESYIVYFSGEPNNLQVEFDPQAVNPNTGAKGMSVLTDFPSLADLASGKYNSSDYAYLSDDYSNVAAAAVNAYAGGGSLTEVQREMIDSALKVKIPEGVQAIKEGLFFTKGKENAGAAGSASCDMSVTAESILEVKTGKELTGGSVSSGNSADGVDPERVTGIQEGTGTFANCEYLTSVVLNNAENNPLTIGDHAFWGCKKLTEASMANVDELGVRPFAGCEELNNVNFQNSSKFVCDNSIIFGLDAGGNKSKVIECLEGRSSKYINPEELTGVSELAKEAFMGCDNLRSVDLTGTTLTEVPDRAFADTTGMQDILLPDTCRGYGKFVFDGTGATRISMPYEGSLIMSDDSFKGLDPDQTAIGCEEGSFIYEWATKNGFEIVPPNIGERTYKVTFRDYENGMLVTVQEEQVTGGKYVTPPQPKGRPGQVFVGWQAEPDNKIYTGPFEVGNDVICTAMYDVAPPDHNKLTVTFRDEDNNFLRDVYVLSGGDVPSTDIPTAPAKEGYTFIGWDRPLTNVTESFTTYPQYRAVAGDECVVRYFVDGNLYFSTVVKTGQDAPNITVAGKPNITWVPSLSKVTKDTDFTAVYEDASPSPSPSPSTSPSASPTPDPNNTGSGNTGSSNTATTLHTLTVQGGTGSGSYVAGTQIIVNANNPPRGQIFSSWTVSPSNTVTTDKTVSSMVVTMPNNDVAIIANFKAGSSSGSNSNGSGGTTGSSNTGNRPGGSAGNQGGTTVVIDKNGLSNTGVVSATVNGSSDNFMIKITENSAASEAVLKALMAEYGSLDNIKYFPMDISLYNAAGTTKITDTTGLKITITLPLPDSLIEYAGNNKVAGVVNDKLDKLSPKFTTINNVSCVTFTAEHFSPYVIYVDLGNLASDPGTDNTPQTGDGIHPKWFLSVGLACLSFIMFMQKDSRSRKKQKVKVRA